MSDIKRQEVRKQVQLMEELGILRKSRATAWSQVLMTPKPNGKWRFTVDYRRLNEVCKLEGWPIPNIQEMIRNIGQQKARYYATMDLTSGYFQAPLDPESAAATAFICACGLYK
jgi:hypothetical protein